MITAGFKRTGSKLPLPEPDVLVREYSQTLFEEAEKVMSDSKENYVPVVTGTLRSTGYVSLPVALSDRVVISLGYGGPAARYALKVHENPRSGKTQGLSPSGKKYGPKDWSRVGEWKYLETPFNQARPRIRAALLGAIRRAYG